MRGETLGDRHLTVESCDNRERETIKERITHINESLTQIDYNPGRYIVLEAHASQDADIRDFQGELRAYLPHVNSFLMDHETLMAHELQWVSEPRPVRRDLVRLSAEERALFDDLRSNRIGPAIRLEQERIGFGWVKKALQSVVEPSALPDPPLSAL